MTTPSQRLAALLTVLHTKKAAIVAAQISLDAAKSDFLSTIKADFTGISDAAALMLANNSTLAEADFAAIIRGIGTVVEG